MARTTKQMKLTGGLWAETVTVAREPEETARDDSDDDGCLSDWLHFYFEGKFHERSQRRGGR